MQSKVSPQHSLARIRENLRIFFFNPEICYLYLINKQLLLYTNEWCK